MSWSITNFVVSAKLTNFSLSDKEMQLLQNSFEVFEIECSYNYKQFFGLLLHFLKPRASFILFPNGHFNLTGCNSFSNLKKSLFLFLQTVQACFSLLSNINKKFCFKIKIENIRIANICGTLKLNFKLNINEIVQEKLLENVYVFEENNNKICYYPFKPDNTCFVIFKTGCINVVGGKNIDKVANTFNFLSLFLKLYEQL